MNSGAREWKPGSLDDLVGIVRGARRVIPVGGGTKPRLSAGDGVVVRLTGLSGVVEYDPSEFTFTAWAGTRVSDIARTLAERGQYLPFDPFWAEAGSTLGGVVASGMSGPGRFRFGGVRDFILGVRFVDGAGRVLRMGGKVVKNAAGFDLPKFFVGSLGRWGVLAEITFKVFPRPQAFRTLVVEVDGMEAVVSRIQEIALQRWECDALEVPVGGRSLMLRIGGPYAALESLASDVLGRWAGKSLLDAEAEAAWADIREFRWAYEGGCLFKVPVVTGTMAKVARELGWLDGAKVHFGAGGQVAYISLSPGESGSGLDAVLKRLGLTGLRLRGDGPMWQGVRVSQAVEGALKTALDVEDRFLPVGD